MDKTKRHPDAEHCMKLADNAVASFSQKGSCTLGQLGQAAATALAKDKMDILQANETISAKVIRIAILKICLALGACLDNYLSPACDRLFDSAVHNVAKDELWLFHLCRSVRQFVDNRIPEKNFKTSDFNVSGSFLQPSCVVKRQHPFDQSDKRKRHVAKEVVLEVLCNWAALRVERWRLWVLSAIVCHLGPGALSLDGTWTIFRTSTDRQLWRGYAPKHQVEPWGLEAFETALETMRRGEEWALCLPLVNHIHALLLGDENASLPEEIPNKQNIEELFVYYIRQSLAVLENTVQEANATDVQRDMIRDPDRRLPFRECIPSLMRMRGPGGPYHEDMPKTTAGLFSCIVWRAVTLRTDFADVERMVFKDLKDWEVYIEGIGPKSYISNASAFGSASQRSPDKVAGYWPAACALNWEARLRDHPHQSFMDVFDLLHPIDSSKARPFNQLGPLGAMHVTSDLAHCGIVPMASNSDIGKCMHLIGSGSAKGASIILENGEDKKLSAKLCSKGAKRAYTILNNALREDERRLIGLDDASMIEHALCKFSGVWKKLV